MSEAVDCVVVGAGVVGLAVARALADAGREVLVLEAEGGIGQGVSSRSSEVIHAGLYYPPGSLKARLCVAGRHALYAFCAERGIAHARCGKLVVATRAEQLSALLGIRARARASGVDDLRFLDADAARALEPELVCAGALLSPSTGIVDSHALMLALQGDAEASGALFSFHSPLLGGVVVDGGTVLEVGGDEPMTLDARLVVNCAGLGAPLLAAALTGFPAGRVPQAHYAKGNYFTLSGRTPFRHLVYPVPEAAGLGVHLTLDLGGQARFGPDVEWIEQPDYSVAAERADAFYGEVRKYWPGLPGGALQPGYAGVRPKIHGPGEVAPDFCIEGPESHGVPGVVQLFGIESPGLTAALAIGQHVAALVA